VAIDLGSGRGGLVERSGRPLLLLLLLLLLPLR
jgi:hypothetical protein